MTDTTSKRSQRPAQDHYRLRLTQQTTGRETFACFPSQGDAARWLVQQQGVVAVLSLVDGPDCPYCRAAKGATA